VPVTAKLSKNFYDRLGEDIVNELVGLLNLIDASYKSELREINEINFARFEAKLEQRIETLRSELKAEIHTGTASLKVVLEQRLGEQTRWMFVAWSALLIPMIGLWFR
jgi:hypothetical protein